ncbi:hypothetical protein [Sphingobacterium spiritivorum]|uniref:hypothetical protein n=1 Tax=Sphingobacterium spiritivorum TaxID=258 RepID=UPI003DA2E3B6
MKKISLKSIKSEELLSREELKQIMGGSGGSGGCAVPCRGGAQTKCIKTNCVPGKCGYYSGIYGCI